MEAELATKTVENVAEYTRGWPHRLDAPRYASEHILSPEFFQQAIERGFLSGEAGRYDGLLYFSEGAHYRGRTSADSTMHGFLFDPEDLEYSFGATPTFMRMHSIFEVACDDPELPAHLTQRFLFPDESRHRSPVSEQTAYDSSGKERPFISNALQTIREEQFGLEAFLQFQRRHNVRAEPEFVIPHRVPLARAIGVSDESGVYWIDPNTCDNDSDRWNLFPVEFSELGGREPGSFSPEWVKSLIIPQELRLHVLGRMSQPDPLHLSGSREDTL